MEDGKLKRLLMMAMAVLCIVLLVMNARLARQIDRLEMNLVATEQELRRQMNQMENSVANRIDSALKELDSAVVGWQLEPLGLDAQAIRCRVAVDLKEWQADTAVTLYFTVAGDARSLSMTRGEGGSFSAEIALSETAKMPLELKAEIRTGETVRQEELGRWSELGLLLPVRLSSWGGSKPQYLAGSLMLKPMHFTVVDKDHRQAKLSDTEFRLYRNGSVMETVPAPAGSQTGGGSDGWGYEMTGEITLTGCKDGDTLRLTAVGVDAYGLGYEFILYDWTVADGKLTQATLAVSPVLFWK